MLNGCISGELMGVPPHFSKILYYSYTIHFYSCFRLGEKSEALDCSICRFYFYENIINYYLVFY